MKNIYERMFCRCRGATRVCNWTEPDFALWQGAPECKARPGIEGDTLGGRLWRVITCELVYGPLNCNFIWSPTNECALCTSRETTISSLFLFEYLL